MRAPASGCRAANSSRVDIKPGISFSASPISLRPKSARERSATLKSAAVAVACWCWSSSASVVGYGGETLASVIVSLDVRELLVPALEREQRLHEAGGVLRSVPPGAVAPVSPCDGPQSQFGKIILSSRPCRERGRAEVCVAAIVRLALE